MDDSHIWNPQTITYQMSFKTRKPWDDLVLRDGRIIIQKKDCLIVL